MSCLRAADYPPGVVSTESGWQVKWPGWSGGLLNAGDRPYLAAALCTKLARRWKEDVMVRKTLLWLAVVALLVGVSGALALAGPGGSEEYTGCLTNKGKIVRVAEGAVPKTGSCHPSQTTVHLAGAAAIGALQVRVDDLESRLEVLETLLAGVTRQGDSLYFPDSIFLPNGGITAGGNLFAGIDVNAGGNIFGANIGSRGEITANGMIMSADRVGAECSNFVTEVCVAFLP